MRKKAAKKSVPAPPDAQPDARPVEQPEATVVVVKPQTEQKIVTVTSARGQGQAPTPSEG